MDIQIAFLAAISFERKRVWKKTARSYEEVLHLISKTRASEHVNKEKLRLLLFECHFHCAVAYQNLQMYQKALQQFRRAMHVVSWRKDDCQAGCITGRVLHLHVPTLARMACCHIHTGHLKEALSDIDKAIVLDFNNPDLFCIRGLSNYLLGRQDQALQDVSFSIKLNSSQVCGWLLRGLFKQFKKEGTGIKSLKKEGDLEKACEVNADAVLFTSVKDLKSHFQAVFDRFLPSIQVSHSLSIRDVNNIPDVDRPSLKGRLETDIRSKQEHSQLKDEISANTRAKTSMFPCSSRPSFVCGVAKLQRISSQVNDKRFYEWPTTESSISHRKHPVKSSSDVTKTLVSLHLPVSSGRCELRVSRLTLRDILNSKRVCACPSERFIGIQDRYAREEEWDSGVGRPPLGERMYARNWIQDRIPTKIPDHTSWPKLPK